MKPRILITMHYMELGGAESALLGLLLAHDPKCADIDLFLYDHRGELMQYIPDTVNLLPEIPAYAMLERPLLEVLKKRYWGIAIGRLIARLLSKIDSINNVNHLDSNSIYHFIAKCVMSFLPRINYKVEYDLAISFLYPHQFVIEKVNAHRKMAWVHTDYTKVYFSDKELPVWTNYDFIATISKDVETAFLQKFPSLSSKVIYIENILSSSFIRERAEDDDVDSSIMEHKEGIVNLLSIGRYCYAKQFDKIPELCHGLNNRLLQSGIKVKWFIIGYGSEEEEAIIRDAIRHYHVEKDVILLGKKENPYPFIKQCDFYIQPSRYEGKSITVREAQILKKPVVTTNFPTAKSQIINHKDGVIVPLETDGCVSGLASFILDLELSAAIISYLEKADYGNESEIKKIYNCAIL